MCFHGTCLDKLALPCANATTKKARAKASAAEAARRAQSAAKIAQLAKDKKEGAEAEAAEAAAAAAAAAATTESGKGAELLKEGEDAAAGVEEFKEDEEEEEEEEAEEEEEEEEEEEPVEEGVSDAAAVADAQLYSDFRATLERGIEVGAPPQPYPYYSTHKPLHSVRRSAAFQCGFSSLCVSLFSR